MLCIEKFMSTGTRFSRSPGKISLKKTSYHDVFSSLCHTCELFIVDHFPHQYVTSQSGDQRQTSDVTSGEPGGQITGTASTSPAAVISHQGLRIPGQWLLIDCHACWCCPRSPLKVVLLNVRNQPVKPGVH